MVRVLSYSQIMIVLRRGFISFDRVVYTLSEADKLYIQENLPESGSNTFGDGRIIGAVTGQGTLVSFQPNGPPDPGLTLSPGAGTIPAPAPL